MSLSDTVAHQGYPGGAIWLFPGDDVKFFLIFILTQYWWIFWCNSFFYPCIYYKKDWRESNFHQTVHSSIILNNICIYVFWSITHDEGYTANYFHCSLSGVYRYVLCSGHPTMCRTKSSSQTSTFKIQQIE